jgi:autotransporter-associated beta strand protein
LSLSGALSPSASASGPVTVIFDAASGTSGSTIGQLSDNGSLVLSITKASAGIWSLSGTNTYTGATTINAGTLRIDNLAALGNATSALLIGSTTAGTLEFTGSTAATLTRGITVNGAGGATISNTGGATLTLSGTHARGARPVTYSGGSFVVSGRITGTSTTSPLTIDSATVRLTHNNNSYVSPTVVQNGGTLISANTNAASSATGTGSVTIDATSTLTGTGFINAGTDNSIFINGQLIVGDPALSAAANLDLTTSGTGSTILGSTSILRLDLFSGAGLGDNSANASAADQLRLLGALDIQSGALLRLGNPNNLTTWADGDTFKLFDWSGLTSVSGTFGIDVTELNLPSGASLDVSNLFTLGTVTIAVPEPGRVALLLLGLGTTLLRRHRPL